VSRSWARDPQRWGDRGHDERGFPCRRRRSCQRRWQKSRERRNRKSPPPARMSVHRRQSGGGADAGPRGLHDGSSTDETGRPISLTSSRRSACIRVTVRRALPARGSAGAPTRPGRFEAAEVLGDNAAKRPVRAVRGVGAAGGGGREAQNGASVSAPRRPMASRVQQARRSRFPRVRNGYHEVRVDR
jgi:hypothetical protein